MTDLYESCQTFYSADKNFLKLEVKTLIKIQLTELINQIRIINYVSFSFSQANKKRSCRDRSRSKSRSRSRSNGRRRRSRSRSPTRKRVVSSTIHQLDHRNVRNDRRSQAFDRERPAENRILGVFGLSQLTTERQLRVLFGEFDGLEEVKMVYDAHTGKSRGFAFVYFESIATSKRAKEKFDGLRLDGCRIRVDFSVTDRAHEPTPGMYMGNSWYVQQDGSKYCPDRLLNAK